MDTGFKIDANGFFYPGKKEFRELRPEQIKTAEAWIQSFGTHRQTINNDAFSYGLKHRAENWGRFMNEHFKTDIFEPYISNGAFIQAAWNVGYIPYPDFYGSINAVFKMSLRHPNQVYKH